MAYTLTIVGLLDQQIRGGWLKSPPQGRTHRAGFPPAKLPLYLKPGVAISQPQNPGHHVMSRIFISYRREDSAGYVGRLHDRLSSHFGDDALFIDIDNIGPGEDFVARSTKKPYPHLRDSRRNKRPR